MPATFTLRSRVLRQVTNAQSGRDETAIATSSLTLATMRDRVEAVLQDSGNTRRAHAADLGVSFYALQIRVELDDDTGANEDFAIEAVSAIYSIDD